MPPDTSIPRSPGGLRRALAWRVFAAALLVGLCSGAAVLLFESRRFEALAIDHALAGARHFESPAMRALLGADGQAHEALSKLLDRSQFIGLRVYDSRRRITFESLSDTTAAPAVRALAQSHEWPVPGGTHSLRISVDGEWLIRVVVALAGDAGEPVGYVEGVTRVDRDTIFVQRERARLAAIASAASVVFAALVIYPLASALLGRAETLSRDLLDSNLSLLRSLGSAVAKRDAGTDSHNYRVTLYAVAIAEAMALPRQEIADLIRGAFLHDIGKIGIPDRILLKPGALTRDEFEIMKTHVGHGLEITRGNRWLAGAALTIAQHHERYDGSGYPLGLRGSAIFRGARVFAVADVFDALTSERSYRRPVSTGDALAHIERESGRHFDPQIVAVFRRVAATVALQVGSASIAALGSMLEEITGRYFEPPPHRLTSPA